MGARVHAGPLQNAVGKLPRRRVERHQFFNHLTTIRHGNRAHGAYSFAFHLAIRDAG
jgi:hypothetical protein